jgi:DNA-binding winged helix-turn-helix (wHTH) protein
MKQWTRPPRLHFGLFEFNVQMGELRRQGLKIKLGQHALKLLALLLEHPGQLRTREEIQQQLWGTNTFVNFDQSLNKAIHQLRQALGDLASCPHYIETVAGRGYRFIYLSQESQQATGKETRSLHSVAVLPFFTEPSDRQMEVLNERMVERLIDTISQTPGVRVLAYSTVQRYREQELNPQMVGRDLLVRVVAAGKMTRPNDELLLHVELIDVEDGTQLWGAQFRESYADALADPQKVADRICSQLLPILICKLSKGAKKGPRHAA